MDATQIGRQYTGTMRRAVLLYNPRSGRANHQHTIERMALALRNQGLEVHAVPTESADSVGSQAAQLADATDTLFACGGDGTLHGVLQGLAHHPTCTLGVIPMGSANVFARHLKLSLDPVEAALQQLAWKPRLLPLGQITYTTSAGERSRYFLALAGAGPDGALVYRMLATGKHRMGRAMYYLRSAFLFATTRFSTFTVITVLGELQVISAMAVRVADLGGLFSPLIPRAEPHLPYLDLSLTLPPAPLTLPLWFVSSWARLRRLNRFCTVAAVDSFQCSAGLTAPVQVQADGEHLGQTPMAVTLVPGAIRILYPPNL